MRKIGRFASNQSPPQIGGWVEKGFEEVRDAFEENFVSRGEVGAACAVYYRGEKIVDLWGGFRDRKNEFPWEEDTLILVFSTTKGIASMAVAVAHSRGYFEYDAPVADYWPEFALNGKEHVTVRQLLSHQAGLCVIDEPLDHKILADPDKLAWILARQKPCWQPGTKHGYHGITLGWYEGELIRRVDPQHRSLGAFFQDEVAGPLEIEFYIGLPREMPESRIACIEDFHPIQMLLHLDALPPSFAKELFRPGSISARAFRNPRFQRPSDMGRTPYREVEIPAGNGIGQVRAIAKAYGAIAAGGKELGLTAATMEALTSPALPPENGYHDEVLQIDTLFSLGYWRPYPAFRFGSSDRSFGAPGAGGSFGFADPELQIGYAYAPNKLGYYLWDDPREKSIRDALYRCLRTIGA